jgi:hypothetical protein
LKQLCQLIAALMVLQIALAAPPDTTAKKPSFEQYPAQGSWDGKEHRPILNNSSLRMFRTRISSAAADKPNFAGHYVLLAVGCGSSCIHMYIVDKNTGFVFEPKVGTIVLDNGCGYDSDEQLTARLNSRLLVVCGELNEDESTAGSYYFEWTGKQLRLLYKSPRKRCRTTIGEQ